MKTKVIISMEEDLRYALKQIKTNKEEVMARQDKDFITTRKGKNGLLHGFGILNGSFGVWIKDLDLWINISLFKNASDAMAHFRQLTISDNWYENHRMHQYIK